MSAKGGKEFLLKVESSGAAGTFTLVGGLRNTSISIGAEAIDVTNQESSQWKTLLDTSGIKNVSVTGSGVFTNDSVLAQVRDDLLAQTLRKFRIIEVSDEYSTSPAFYEGTFKIGSLERAGEYNKEQTWSIKLDSSGAVTFTAGV